MPADLQAVLAKDPLHVLTEQDARLVWSARRLLLPFATALPKFLKAVEWSKREAVQEAYTLLHKWARPLPTDALQLLDSHFPDPKVRCVAPPLQQFSA